MPRPRKAVLRVIVGVVFVITLLLSAGLTQTSVNDIHVVPRQMSPTVANAVASAKVVDGSILHVVKTDVQLVLVPVSATDPKQRPVTGLRAENSQLLEGKKPQEIRHFSRRIAPACLVGGDCRACGRTSFYFGE